MIPYKFYTPSNKILQNATYCTCHVYHCVVKYNVAFLLKAVDMISRKVDCRVYLNYLLANK